MKCKNRTIEDKITTLDDRDGVEFFMFEPDDRALETLQSALEISRLVKERDGGAQ